MNEFTLVLCFFGLLVITLVVVLAVIFLTRRKKNENPATPKAQNISSPHDQNVHLQLRKAFTQRNESYFSYLTTTNDPKVIKEIIKALNSNEGSGPTEHQAWVEFVSRVLFKVGEPAKPLLFDDLEYNKSSKAHFALSKFGEAILPNLISYINEGKIVYMSVIDKMDRNISEPLLASFLKHENIKVREKAVWHLMNRYGYYQAQKNMDNPIKKILLDAIIMDEPQTFICGDFYWLIFITLVNTKEQIEEELIHTVRIALSNPNPYKRAGIASMLYMLFEKGFDQKIILNFLKELLRDDHHRVREIAIKELSRFKGDKGVYDILLNIASQENEKTSVKVAAVMAISTFTGHPTTARDLINILFNTSMDLDIRACALVHCSRYLGKEIQIQEIAQFLIDPSPKIREALMQAVGENNLGNELPIDALFQLFYTGSEREKGNVLWCMPFVDKRTYPLVVEAITSQSYTLRFRGIEGLANVIRGYKTANEADLFRYLAIDGQVVSPLLEALVNPLIPTMEMSFSHIIDAPLLSTTLTNEQLSNRNPFNSIKDFWKDAHFGKLKSMLSYCIALVLGKLFISEQLDPKYKALLRENETTFIIKLVEEREVINEDPVTRLFEHTGKFEEQEELIYLKNFLDDHHSMLNHMNYIASKA